MTVTVDLDQALIECATCPNTAPGKERAYDLGWQHCSESGDWQCDCCSAEEHRYWAGQLAHLVRANREHHANGDHEYARLVAESAGVRDDGHESKL
jgi:hypothetical protein